MYSTLTFMAILCLAFSRVLMATEPKPYSSKVLLRLMDSEKSFLLKLV